MINWLGLCRNGARLMPSLTRRFTSRDKDGIISMSEKEYWDRFYTQNNKNTFEWLMDESCINEIVDCLQQNTNKKEKLALMLDAGCGSSLFSSKLARSISSTSSRDKNAPVFLICADFSRQALELIQKNLQPDHSLVDFIECDCKRLPIRDNLFDLIMDKGYTDSVLKTSGLMSESSVAALDSMNNMIEKLDCLENKYLIQITDETPELRITLFDQSKFEIGYFFKEINIDENFTYFTYFIYKK